MTTQWEPEAVRRISLSVCRVNRGPAAKDFPGGRRDFLALTYPAPLWAA
jgi:hypothetical protein